jgi:cobalt transporter subunit CbtB
MVNNPAVSSIERTDSQTRRQLKIGVASNAIIAAMVATALGAAMLFAVGFSHSDLLHAAAHDVRHAAGFPCH